MNYHGIELHDKNGRNLSELCCNILMHQHRLILTVEEAHQEIEEYGYQIPIEVVAEHQEDMADLARWLVWEKVTERGRYFFDPILSAGPPAWLDPYAPVFVVRVKRDTLLAFKHGDDEQGLKLVKSDLKDAIGYVK